MSVWCLVKFPESQKRCFSTAIIRQKQGSIVTFCQQQNIFEVFVAAD